MRRKCAALDDHDGRKHKYKLESILALSAAAASRRSVVGGGGNDDDVGGSGGSGDSSSNSSSSSSSSRIVIVVVVSVAVVSGRTIYIHISWHSRYTEGRRVSNNGSRPTAQLN
ncbi:hypothetical protein HZH66_010607 [Vespula vulgaris]|uniref:Uncharacterized protein n=1 Tax=Vespula vulgaris TaxID=7454 RepID=A0A834MWH2_VESVU|nr:hypothetical protein HZH66_010607 [Vespula vulgaris]